MQSVVKRSDASNVYKLSDLANADQDADFDASGGIGKKSASPAQSDKDRSGDSHSKSPEAPVAENAGQAAEVAPSSADDALAWLRIIQNATADLTADIRASKGDSFAPSLADEEAPFARHSPPSSGGYAGNVRPDASFHDDMPHDDYSDERKLAQKLSYRNAETRHAPAQSLAAAVWPYVAATGILAFIAGCAAVYFLTGSPSADVKARAVSPAAETQGEAPLAHSDQSGAKKGGLQRAASPALSGDGATILGPKAEEQGAKPAGPASPADHQVQTWSDTVETFKQFVRPEQK